MPTEDLDKLLMQMEKLPAWKLWLLRIFMEIYSAAWRLARRLGLVKPGEIENL